ncbi:MAG: DMT family transporter [Gemmatimonadaceae bacterium]
MTSLVAASPTTATEPARPWFAYSVLASAVICVAWSALFVRWAAVSGPASAFYRVLVATVVLVPVWLLRGRRNTLRLRPALLGALAGVFFAFDLALFNTAVLDTSAANATLLGNNAPIVVGLGSWLIFRKPPRAIFWVGLALALVGSGFIIGHDALGHTSFGAGDAMAISASAFFAAYMLTIERVRTQMDTLTLTTLAVTASSVTLLLVCLVARVPLVGYSSHAWLSLIGLGLVSQVGGYLALTYALGHLPATVTSVGMLGQAPLTALLAIPLLGEPLIASQVIGGALVIAGIYVVNSRYTSGMR